MPRRESRLAHRCAGSRITSIEHDTRGQNTQELSREQRRLLRRIYNGRTVPILMEGNAFLTFKQASRYLQSLVGEARDTAYAEMKRQAASGWPGHPQD